VIVILGVLDIVPHAVDVLEIVLVAEIVDVPSPVLETSIEPVIVPEALVVLELLIEPVIVGVVVDDLEVNADLVGLNVAILDNDFLALNDILGLPVTLLLRVCVGDGLAAPLLVGVTVMVIVPVLLIIEVTLAELVIEEVLVDVIVLDDVGDPVTVYVLIGVPVIVLESKADLVFLKELEELAETVEVLLGRLDLVLVIVLNAVFDIGALKVEDLLIVVVLDEVVVELIVLEDETDLLTELDPVPVFVEVIDGVPVNVNFKDFVLIEVAEMEAELEDVFEGCVDLLYVGELEGVFEIGAERVLVGLAEFVLDIRPDALLVLETVVVLVAVLLEVRVLVLAEETVIPGEDEDDFETVAHLVEVWVPVWVLVEVGLGVNWLVGYEDLVPVVVLVEVLEEVGDIVFRTFWESKRLL